MWKAAVLFAGVAIAGQLAFAQPAATSPATRPADDGRTRIVLAGDSTVTLRAGWGTGFAERFDPARVAVINLAQGGRSSKSYRDEGWWQQCLDARPDYVLIQFGHNDQPGKGPERETDPATTFRENLARYVAEARAIGAKPVLVTSIERRRYDAAGKLRPSLAAYADAARAVAAKENVPLLDLNARTIALYEQQGEAAWAAMSPTDKDGKVDTTHLNEQSSRVVGDVVVEELTKAMPALSGVIVERKRG